MARSSLFPPSVQPGKPILPPCPAGWTTVTFGDVLDIVERPIDLVDDVEYQLVTAKRSRGGVVARSRLLGHDVLTKTQFLIERDDFLMSNRQIIHGGCGIVPPALAGAVVSNEYSVLRPNSKLLLEFLRYLSHSIYFQQTCFHASVGVDVEKMIFDCERWLEFKIHLPPLREQRQIAEILSGADDAIAATRAVIEQTRKVKQGVLQHLLTKGISHTRFKHTQIGEIAERWEVHRIADVASVKGGKRMPAGRPFSDSKTDHPYIRVSDFRNGSIDRGGVVYVLPEDQKLIARYTISWRDVYISIAGTIGVSGMIPKDLDGAQLTENAAKITVRSETQLMPEFLALLVSSEVVQRQILTAKGVGGGVPKLALFRIEAMTIPVPPRDEQEQIVNRLLSLNNALTSDNSSLDALSSAKSALMSDLLTGRKRITENLPMAAE